jgi:glycerol dehydrogenase
VQLVLEKSNRTELDEVLSFSASVGLPITLREIGCEDLTDEMLSMVAARTTAPGETIHNEPFHVTESMVAEAILEADAAGNAFKNKTA